LHDLEQLWYRAGDERGDFARKLLKLVERSAKVPGRRTGREVRVHRPHAHERALRRLEVKEELETIDKLLKQLDEAEKTAQIAVIDMEQLAQFAEPGDLEQLSAATADPGLPARTGGAAGAGANARRLPHDAEGVPPVPVETAGDDL
jgi:hypothetical protein